MKTKYLSSTNEETIASFSTHFKLNRRNKVIRLILMICLIGVYFGSTKLNAQNDQKLTKPEIQVTSPKAGTIIPGSHGIVIGNTNIKDVKMKYYVIIIPKDSDSWVQDCRPKPDTSSGNFSCNALFGNSKFGSNEDFRIKIMASKMSIKSGVMASPPEDAIYSEEVKIHRK